MIKIKNKKKVFGTEQRPRLVVSKTNRYVYGQIIDDSKGKTLIFVSSMSKEVPKSGTKTQKAKLIGLEIAKKAKLLGIEKIVFDRNGYLYHGIIKALAEGARELGLNF